MPFSMQTPSPLTKEELSTSGPHPPLSVVESPVRLLGRDMAGNESIRLETIKSTGIQEPCFPRFLCF